MSLGITISNEGRVNQMRDTIRFAVTDQGGTEYNLINEENVRKIQGEIFKGIKTEFFQGGAGIEAFEGDIFEGKSDFFRPALFALTNAADAIDSSKKYNIKAKFVAAHVGHPVDSATKEGKSIQSILIDFDVMEIGVESSDPKDQKAFPRRAVAATDEYEYYEGLNPDTRAVMSTFETKKEKPDPSVNPLVIKVRGFILNESGALFAGRRDHSLLESFRSVEKATRVDASQPSAGTSASSDSNKFGGKRSNKKTLNKKRKASKKKSKKSKSRKYKRRSAK